jgi:enamine deaminase RidA (YjgF/YER057c/UK114 family)
MDIKEDRFGRRMVSSGSRYEELAGYSRAVVDGEWIFVSGTVGYDLAAGVISPDVAEQARQAIANIADALAAAEADHMDIVRLREFVSEREPVWPVSAVLRETFSDWRPTNTTLVVGFAEPELKVELEATARRRRR